MAKMKFNLATLIFIGFGLGIVAGVFFGEYCAKLHVIGEGFLLLLQMAVLPYIMFAMISGIGKLSVHDAISLAKKVGSFILVLWAIALLVILTMANTYPAFESAPFFSHSLIEQVAGPDFLRMYIPANPFQSLADSMVPAVVLFSIVVGIALIGVEKKQHVIDFLSTMTQTMLRVMDMVIKLSPVGIFAITANAAGTMEATDLDKLQLYFIGYLAFWALLCFWILPNLITTFTPFTYRDVVGHFRDVLVTAFATGSLFIVLPLMATRARELFEKKDLDVDQADTAIDVVVGTSFNFPDLGKLLTLSFVPFAAWFVGSPLSVEQYPSFLLAGLFSFFGDVVLAMLFLLDLLRVPADTFNLFIVADVPISRFGTMLAAMHTLTLTLLCASATIGILKIGWARVGRFTAITVGVVLISAFGVRFIGGATFNPSEDLSKSLLEIPLKGQIPFESLKVTSEPEKLQSKTWESTLYRIRELGRIRAGIRGANFPFSYYTKAHGLVGYDVEMAQTLAKDLDVELVLVPFNRDNAAEKLRTGEIDVIMSGMLMTPDRIGEMSFPVTHIDTTAAFIVKDHLRDKFKDLETINSMKGLRIAVLDIPYYVDKIRVALPWAKVVVLEHATDFFEMEEDLDAMFYSAEAGSAWCILHPSYSVVTPKPRIYKFPVGYPIIPGDTIMSDFMKAWVELKRKDGTIESLFDHWILGQGAKTKEPRWSVIRNVLKWVE